MEEKTKSIAMVIDSSIFIDHLREHPPAKEFFRKLSLTDTSAILFSALTETELIAGKSCEDSDARSRVLQMLNRFTKVSVDNPLALLAGDICRKNALDLPDAVIAATALTHKVELLTRNVSDFKKVEGLKVRSPY